MARKTKEQKAREDNLNAFFEALETMEKEKGISREYIAEKIAGAIVVSAKKDYGSKDVVFCNIDCEKKIFDVFVKKTVVDEVEDPDTEILLEDALKISKIGCRGRAGRNPPRHTQLRPYSRSDRQARHPSGYTRRRKRTDTSGIPEQKSGAGHCRCSDG